MEKYYIVVSYLYKNWNWVFEFTSDTKIETKTDYYELIKTIKKWITRSINIWEIIICNILYLDNI